MALKPAPLSVGTVEQFPTRTKAREAKDEIMRRAREVTVVTRFDYLCDNYLDCGIDHMRGYSKISRRSVVETLRTQFGEYRLDFLCTAPGRAKIEGWLNGTNMTANYRKHIKRVLRKIFRHAMRKDFLKGDNPAKLIDIRNRPDTTKKKRPRKLITPEQYAALQEDNDLPEFCKVIVSVMHMSGTRGCEALGLSWEHRKPGDGDYRECDIDISSKPPKLHICRSVKEGK